MRSLDALLADHNKGIPPLREFILPGGTRAAALAHLARTVCRRAERSVVALGRAEPVGERARQYLNRLSDLLFVLGRALNRAGKRGDVLWRHERKEKDLTMRTLLLALLLRPARRGRASARDAVQPRQPECRGRSRNTERPARRRRWWRRPKAPIRRSSPTASTARCSARSRPPLRSSRVKARSGAYQTLPVYEKSRVARWRVRQELRLESADFAAATELIGKLQASLMVTGMNAVGVGRGAAQGRECAASPRRWRRSRNARALVRDAMKAKGLPCARPAGIAREQQPAAPDARDGGALAAGSRAARRGAGKHAHPYHGVRNHPVAVNAGAVNPGAGLESSPMPAHAPPHPRPRLRRVRHGRRLARLDPARMPRARPQRRRSRRRLGRLRRRLARRLPAGDGARALGRAAVDEHRRSCTG